MYESNLVTMRNLKQLIKRAVPAVLMLMGGAFPLKEQSLTTIRSL